MKNIFKPLIFLAFIVAGFATEAMAQYITVGPRIGANLSNMTNVPGSATKASPTIGLFAMYSDRSHWGIGLEALYTREGAKQQLPIGERNLDLNYIKVPVSLNYFFGPYDAKLRPKVYAGPYVSVLTNENAFSDQSESFVRYDYERVDFGLMVGGGLNVEVSTAIWMNAGIRYNQGLLDVAESFGDTEGQLNQNLQFLFGIGFGL